MPMSILAILVWVFSVTAASGQAIKVNVAYGGAGGDPLPVIVAKETRLFEQNGLDARLIYFSGGTTSVLA